MIFKNVVTICNSHKRIFLYNSPISDVQWVGDGKAFYPLHGVDPDTGEVIA